MSKYLQGKSDYAVNGKGNNLDIDSLVEFWLEETVKNNTTRRLDICREKRRSVLGFFLWLGKSPEMVSPIDIRNWAITLKRGNLASSTIHNRLLTLSNFFEFLRFDAGEVFGNLANPVKDNIPKRPKIIRLDKVNVLSTKDLSNLVDVVKKFALSGEPCYLRDYAILQVFTVTSWSRQEASILTGENIKITNEGVVLISPKGKNSLNSEVKLNDEVANALLAYLKATGRDENICGTSNPLWLRHDIGSKNIQNPKLTSHSVARRMNFYADRAGIKDFHLHKLRWNCPTIVTEEWKVKADVRKTSSQKNSCDTDFNIQRIRVYEDKFSELLFKRVLEMEKKQS